MNGTWLLLSGCVWFGLAYRYYGRRLERIFGIDPERRTPAYTHTDGVDYVPTKPSVLFGHHFASIAGAGPIVGPILAIQFGWLPAVLWILLGCVVIGAMHDFAALHLSVRDNGRSIGHVIERNLGYSGRQVFIIFCWATLVLVVAVFAILVAKTFTERPAVATSSLLLIMLAPLLGWLVYRRNLPLLPVTVVFVGLLCLSIWAGTVFPLKLSVLVAGNVQQTERLWLGVLLLYSFVASVLPVWILLQPRDYLNSFLLYGLILLGFAGVVFAQPALEAPVFEGWVIRGEGGNLLRLFPLLFVTVACGACSGFHALVASGTTSKQISKEQHILPVGYGAMLIEGVLALMAIVSVAYLGKERLAEVLGGGGPVVAFAAGLAAFVNVLGIREEVARNFFTLAISAFLLTTLDTATRLARFAWQELFLPRGGDERQEQKRSLILCSNRYIATLLVLLIAGYLAFSGQYRVIWPLFGASNQLLAGLTLLVITVVLRKQEKSIWVSLLPMLFMMVTCISALLLLLKDQLGVNKVLVTLVCVLLLMALALVVQAARHLLFGGSPPHGKRI